MLATLPLLRGVHLLCLVSLLGTLTARCVVAPNLDAGHDELIRLARYSLLLAVPTLLAWLFAQAGSLADAATLGGAVAALPTVLVQTRFGHVLALRLILLAVAWPLIGHGRTACIVAVVLVAAALALQAALGHAGAAGGAVGVGLGVSEGLHLIAAGAWLGGLLPLLILVAGQTQPVAVAAARRFTMIGLPAVLVLIATALVQADAFIGGIPGLFGTEYGHIALAKLALFAVLLVLALINRFVLTTRFEHGQARRAVLAAAVGIEALAGIAVVMAAAALASLEPGAHAEPVWPFALRPSMVALADPDLRWELTQACAVGAAAIVMIAAGLALRRCRLPLLAVGLAAMTFALPHLRPLLVEAYPTSYVQSPTDFTAASIMRGAAVFAANCVQCHGVEGRGDGPAAKTLAVPPANLTELHLWEHSDGELFWWLTHGMDNPNGGQSMPGFASVLSDDDRWAVIDFIRAQNAGVALHATGAWPVPVRAPALPLVCADGSQTDMQALRGQLVEISAGPPPGAPAVGGPAAVLLALHPSSGHVASGCLAATPEAWPAFAILTGVTPAALAGSVMIVDSAGWLRSVFHGDGETGDATLVTSLLADIGRHPLTAPTGGLHAHH